MKRILPLMLVCCLWAGVLRAQDFMNGDFEINNGTAGTHYGNISNTIFNNLLPFCHSYAPTFMGMTGSLDLLWGPSNTWGTAYSGNRFVGIVPYPGDIFSMELDQPLQANTRYRISFYQRNDGIAEPLDFGLSTVNDDFGAHIGTAPVSVTPLGVWDHYAFEFDAPNNGRFVSLRMQPQPGAGAWTMVDRFGIEPVPCEPVLDLGPDRALCGGQPVLLDPQGPVNYTYLWSDLSTAPTLTVGQPGTYWVVAVRGACSDSDTVTIGPGEVPEVLFAADRTEGCAPMSVTFAYTGHAQPGYTYAWDMGNGNMATGNPAGAAFAQEGCRDISLTVTNAWGCSATRSLAQYICVRPAPEAAFTFMPQPVFTDEPRVRFTDQSTGHISGQWQFGDGGFSAEENPEHTYPVGQGMDYVVWRSVVSEWGCTDTAWDTVRVIYPFVLFVPDAFTPNGDNNNPTFVPLVAAPFGVAEYRLRIYDRWGGEQFSTTDILQGWDGTLNGKPVPEGIYLWKISVRDPYSQRRIERTGRLTLVR